MSDVIFEIIEEDVVFEIQNGNTYNVNGAETLNDLTDVNINPSLNDVLRYDGSEWVESDLSDKAAAIHNHVISDVTNLQTSLDGKASSVHTHSESDITNLVGHLAAKSDVGHTHTIANVSNLQSTLDGKAAVSHNHTISQVTSLQSSLDAKQNTITGAASTVTNVNLVPSSVVVTDAFGKITTSPTISSTELSYLNNVTSNVQTQINAKASASHTHDDRYFTESETTTLLSAKQDALVSGTNLKTVNNTSLLGTGNIEITAGAGALSDLTDVQLTNVASGEILVFDGTNWVNQDGGSQAMTHKVLSNTNLAWNDLFSFTLLDGESAGGELLIVITAKTNEGSIATTTARYIYAVVRDTTFEINTGVYDGERVAVENISINTNPSIRLVLSGDTVTLQIASDYTLLNGETLDTIYCDFTVNSSINSISTNPNVVWGDITGDITNQTDLDLILNGLQPALGYTPEDVANKATNLTTPDNTTYPSTLAVTTALSGYSETSHNHNLNDLTEKSYNSLTDKPSLFSGSYTDLTNKPAIPSALSSLTKDINFDERYYTETENDTLLSAKQTALVSGTSIKTINSTSLLGSGDIAVQPTLVNQTNIKSINGTSLLGSGDLVVGSNGGSTATQSFTSQTSIVFAHNFGVYPVVNVIDNNGAVLVPLTITHTSVNSLTVTFTSATTGTIIASVGTQGIQGESGGLTVYTPTTANCENTTTQTSVISFTIPANTWQDGEIVSMLTPYNYKNNSGSASNFQRDWYYGSLLIATHTASMTNAATEYMNVVMLRFQRVGNDVYMYARNTSPANANVNNEVLNTAVGIDSTTTLGTYHTYIFKDAGTYDFNFASDITITMKVTHQVANANTYYRNYDTKIWKI